jgi:hypothetical protein
MLDHGSKFRNGAELWLNTFPATDARVCEGKTKKWNGDVDAEEGGLPETGR